MSKALVIVTSCLIPLLAPAQAQAKDIDWGCQYNMSVYPLNGHLDRHRASISDASDYCGKVGVNVQYRLYEGSPTYWTGWKYREVFAEWRGPNLIYIRANFNCDMDFGGCEPRSITL